MADFEKPRVGIVLTAGLSLRSEASASSRKFGSLPRETVLTVFGETMNGETKWYRIKTPSGYPGYVAAAHIQLGAVKQPKVTRQFIIDELCRYGWSREVGYGAAANSSQESSFEPDAVGDGLKAYGLFQWHGDRQAKFAAQFGKPITEATPKEQVAFVDWELRNTERAAGAALKKATTAYEAGAMFSKHFERPKAAEAEAHNRGTVAQKWFDEDRNLTALPTKK